MQTSEKLFNFSIIILILIIIIKCISSINRFIIVENGFSNISYYNNVYLPGGKLPITHPENSILT